MDPASIAKKIYVPTYDEVLTRIKTRYPHNMSPLERERRSLELARNVVLSKTEAVVKLSRLIRSLHPFYRRLLETKFDMIQVEKDLSCVLKARRVADIMWRGYQYRLLAAEGQGELKAIGREGRGRILSQLRRCSDGLERLKEVVKFLAGLPGVDVDKPIVIVAGPPNAGKSTLVATLSSARPQVAPYPFTTKNVIVGHLELNGQVVQLVDTPGLLDRAPEDMNEIERRAVAAIEELPGPVLFLMDPTPESTMDLRSQLDLLSRVMGWLGSSRRLVVAVNKVDEVEPEISRAVLEVLRSKVKADDYLELVAYDREKAVNAIKKALGLG